MTQAADGWEPTFEGQRPPFAAGNDAARTHGARSERAVVPLATQIASELLATPDCPPHLHEAIFAPSLHAWARAEAMVTLLWQFVADQDIQGAMTEVSTGLETEQTTRKGQTTRKSAAKRVASALDQLRRYETLAANLRSRLGLDPASAAKISRDLAARRFMDGATPLDSAVAAIARHRALQAAPEDTSGQ